MTNMLKKDNEVKWSKDARKSVNIVKFSLTTAHVSISPDYTIDFIIFSFSSNHTIFAILMQNKDKTEQPISFFSRIIRDAALWYNIIEKQALALIKVLKDFRVCILHSHTLAYVPNAAIKDVLMKTYPKGRKGKWIVAMLEYDLEIKPTKLIKCQGLAKLMAESNLHVLDINLITTFSNEEKDVTLIQVSDMFLSSPWYSNIIYVLQHLNPPPGMTKSKGRSLKLKASKYFILDGALYWKDPGSLLLNFLVESEAQEVMNDFHKGVVGATFSGRPQLIKYWARDTIGQLYLQIFTKQWWVTMSDKFFKVKENWFHYLCSLLQFMHSFNSGDLNSSERFTLLHLHNTNGYLQPLTTSPNGSKWSQQGKQ